MCRNLHFQAPAMPLEGIMSNSQRVCAASPGECRGLLNKSIFYHFSISTITTLKWCLNLSDTIAASSRAVHCVAERCQVLRQLLLYL